jgi:primosomal protein N'
MNALNISSSPIETMVKKGQLEAFLVPKYLNKTRDLNNGPSFKEVSVKEHVEISETLKNHKTILLTGASHETLDALAFKVTLERPTQRKLFILPEIFMIEAMALKMSQEIEVTVYHSKMSSSEKKDSYERFLNGTLCLTTPSGFFLDLDHTDLVIVTHAHDPAYQSLERPRFDVIMDALNLQERFNYELMLVSKTLPASLHQTKIHSVNIGEEPFKINTHIVDLRPHVLHHPNRLITSDLDEVIQKTLNQNQNVLLIHHQKGGYKQLRCAQCGTSYVCETCLNVATLKQGNPFCETCQIPLEKSVCETCLKPYQAIDPGLDILKEEVINQYHVEPEIITSESTDFLERYLVKTSPRIILGTKAIMRALDFYKIGCVGIIQMEDLVMGHAYDEAWIMISELLEANERLNKGFDFVIQTYDINQRVFKD